MYFFYFCNTKQNLFQVSFHFVTIEIKVTVLHIYYCQSKDSFLQFDSYVFNVHISYFKDIFYFQADADFYHLSETTKDYIHLIGAVKVLLSDNVLDFCLRVHGSFRCMVQFFPRIPVRITGKMMVNIQNRSFKKTQHKLHKHEG